MEPWDGPAALAMTDGRWVVAGVDRSALRPLRYSLTNEKLLIVGSETGMVVVPESNIIQKGRLGPGQMIAVDLDEGCFLHDQEIKERIAGAQPYGEWVKGFTDFSNLAGFGGDEPGIRFDRADQIGRAHV